MKLRNQKKLTLASIIGLGYWFFGNMYEAIVISPNWIVDSQTQMKRLHEFFVNTTPTLYFVPVTQIATLLVWYLFFANKTKTVIPDYKKAAFFSVLVTLVNIYIVSTIVLKLFGADYEKYGEYLSTLTWRWNVLNVLRMILVAIVVHYLFSVYRKLDKIE